MLRFTVFSYYYAPTWQHGQHLIVSVSLFCHRLSFPQMSSSRSFPSGERIHSQQQRLLSRALVTASLSWVPVWMTPKNPSRTMGLRCLNSLPWKLPLFLRTKQPACVASWISGLLEPSMVLENQISTLLFWSTLATRVPFANHPWWLDEVAKASATVPVKPDHWCRYSVAPSESHVWIKEGSAVRINHVVFILLFHLDDDAYRLHILHQTTEYFGTLDSSPGA